MNCAASGQPDSMEQLWYMSFASKKAAAAKIKRECKNDGQKPWDTNDKKRVTGKYKLDQPGQSAADCGKKQQAGQDRCSTDGTTSWRGINSLPPSRRNVEHERRGGKQDAKYEI